MDTICMQLLQRAFIPVSVTARWLCTLDSMLDTLLLPCVHFIASLHTVMLPGTRRALHLLAYVRVCTLAHMHGSVLYVAFWLRNHCTRDALRLNDTQRYWFAVHASLGYTSARLLPAVVTGALLVVGLGHTRMSYWHRLARSTPLVLL